MLVRIHTMTNERTFIVYLLYIYIALERTII